MKAFVSVWLESSLTDFSNRLFSCSNRNKNSRINKQFKSIFLDDPKVTNIWNRQLCTNVDLKWIQHLFLHEISFWDKHRLLSIGSWIWWIQVIQWSRDDINWDPTLIFWGEKMKYKVTLKVKRQIIKVSFKITEHWRKVVWSLFIFMSWEHEVKRSHCKTRTNVFFGVGVLYNFHAFSDTDYARVICTSASQFRCRRFQFSLQPACIRVLSVLLRVSCGYSGSKSDTFGSLKTPYCP